ncbi:DUF4435 domain-containing protein [Flavobacterium branchiicola]|uniref:DUF4435 domain-containing protein n=1 Tax=Flavobacterium branchiicola TaxID=1114875 RepID=A0ABV9P7V8_9FLAO|nr:DUF4435 domain-containing protein [Flavobacterium branchiicola]MBS7252503.1 DUF4435 domain-containing protein [Flavobacterium branchiicola]
MSSFTRTRTGLNNQHLFHDVDFIMFLEGGKKSFTKAEALAGSYNEETEDIIFWKNIFDTFANDKRIKFKSIGSKVVIKDMLVDIVDGRLTTILLAMDNEFDEIFNRRINHPQVYYTYGYSWENDVWNHNVVKSVIEGLTAVKITNDDIEKNLNNFLAKIKVAVNADGYLFKKGASFLPRKTGIFFCVECAPVDLPYVRTNDVNERLELKGLKRSTVNSFGRRYLIDPHKFCYGHLLADYCCQVIIHYIRKRHLLPTMHKDIIYRMGINKFFESYFEAGHIYDYYSNMFQQKQLLD